MIDQPLDDGEAQAVADAGRAASMAPHEGIEDPGVVVLGHAVWQRWFDADPEVQELYLGGGHG